MTTGFSLLEKKIEFRSSFSFFTRLLLSLPPVGVVVLVVVVVGDAARFFTFCGENGSS